MIRIIVDSSADFQAKELQAKQIELVPITVTIGDRSYLDGIDLKRDTFYEILTESGEFPKTSQPSPQAFLDAFLDAKAKGDDVICITVSSALSGTCQSAMLARTMADYDNIYIVDSLAATHIIRIMADYACTLRTQGLHAPAIAAALQILRPRIKVAAVVDTLEYLQRGGRLSKTAAAIGELASLKPMITITEEGTVGVLGKSIGKNKAAINMLKHILGYEIDTQFPVYTLFTYGTDNCARFEERLSEEGICPTNRLQIGPSIGAHVGPEAFGVIWVSKE